MGVHGRHDHQWNIPWVQRGRFNCFQKKNEKEEKEGNNQKHVNRVPGKRQGREEVILELCTYNYT